jgi:hypothetical protein
MAMPLTLAAPVGWNRADFRAEQVFRFILRSQQLRVHPLPRWNERRPSLLLTHRGIGSESTRSGETFVSPDLGGAISRSIQRAKRDAWVLTPIGCYVSDFSPLLSDSLDLDRPGSWLRLGVGMRTRLGYVKSGCPFGQGALTSGSPQYWCSVAAPAGQCAVVLPRGANSPIPQGFFAGSLGAVHCRRCFAGGMQHKCAHMCGVASVYGRWWCIGGPHYTPTTDSDPHGVIYRLLTVTQSPDCV